MPPVFYSYLASLFEGVKNQTTSESPNVITVEHLELAVDEQGNYIIIKPAKYRIEKLQ